MSETLDDRLRSALGSLRKVPVPPPPALPTVPEPARSPLGLIAAAAMVAVLLGSLFFQPGRPAEGDRLRSQVAALEERISRVEHGELRSLLDRELALLRRELELACGSAP